MAKTTAQTFYATTATADQTLTGAGTVRAVSETAPTTANFGTMTWSTTSVAQRTWIPGAGSTSASDTTGDNGMVFNAFATSTSGLESVTGARRLIPAGIWSFVLAGTVGNPALLQTGSINFRAEVYRVAAGGGARTRLFVSNVVSDTWTAAGSVGGVSGSSQPQYILEPGETLEVGVLVNSAATSGLAGTTNTILTIPIGSAGMRFSVPPPGICTAYDQNAGVATSSPVGFLVRQITRNVGVGTATALASAVKKAILRAPMVATATALASSLIKSVTKYAGNATASAAAATLKKVILSPRTATATAVATLQPRAITKLASATATAMPFLQRLITLTPKNATVTGVAIFDKHVVYGRRLTATATAVGKAFIQMSQAVLNRISSGGGITKKVINYLFDD